MLDLDATHRLRNPLGPALGAEVRRVVGEALGCAAIESTATEDLSRTRRPADAASSPVSGRADASDDERAALAFARRLTLEAADLSDDEVADLIERYGPDDVVALVHTVAYANFQARLLFALGLDDAPSTATPPLELRLPRADDLAVPPRNATPAPPADATPQGGYDAALFDALRERLAEQRARTARIEDPGPVRLARLPRPMRPRMGRIAWGTVSTGYQPELTRAWFRAMDAFDREAQLDQVIASSTFWVMTNESDCFY